MPKRGRGRPRKESEENVGVGVPDDHSPDIDLFNISEEPEEELEPETDEINLFEIEAEEEKNTNIVDEPKVEVKPVEQPKQANMLEEQENKTNVYRNTNLYSLLTRDKKIVSFVGTTKNGTSFVVNNLAELFSSMGISTAILDVTQNRNAYYVYTKNQEQLRKTAENSISKLRRNIADGVKVNKNLTVYTAIPNSREDITDVDNIISTLVQNHSLVLIDCDFETPKNYFYNSQEIYLVQSMDVLTIQPFTAFLRDLKANDILEEDRLKIIINKEIKVGGISPKVIIGGMAFYNDPAMSFMTELFDRTKVKYNILPFEGQNYSKYLESLVNCSISIKGYTKQFMGKLKELASVVYPLVGKQVYSYKDSFSNETSSTLDKMKNGYK